MATIEGYIGEIQDNIFSYNINGARKKIGLFIEQLSQVIALLSQDQIGHLNDILKLLDTGISNNDFLLAADILEYEMRPFLEGITTVLNGS